MTEASGFQPTIPIAVRRLTSEHLADGQAEARAAVGPTGFTTRYLTTLHMADDHCAAELLADDLFELVLSTGHVLAGHFYSSPMASPERPVFLFIPAALEPAARSEE